MDYLDDSDGSLTLDKDNAVKYSSVQPLILPAV